MDKTMASAQSLMGLVSQLQNMETSFTAILMEAAMKMATLTDANVFLLVESQDGRKFSGKRHLCEAYLNGTLTPIGNDAEFEVNPAVSSLQVRRHHGGGNGATFQQQQQQQQQSRMFSSPQGGRNFSSSPFSPTSSRQGYPPHSPSSVRKRQFHKSSLPTTAATGSSLPLPPKYPRVSTFDEGVGDDGGVGKSSENHAQANEDLVRVKDEISGDERKKVGDEIDNDIAEIIEESSSHSNGDGAAAQRQQHSSSGKASTASSSSNGALEISAWESSSGAGVGVDEEFDSAGVMDDAGDYFGGGDAAGFGNGVGGEELELMNLLNANLSSQKIHTLKCIVPLNACVKGTPENRLSTSLCYDFGKGKT